MKEKAGIRIARARLAASLFSMSAALYFAPHASDAAAKELPDKPTLADVIKASTSSDWRPLDAVNTLYLEIPAGRVVIELAPYFAPDHVANVKALVREGYFDGPVSCRRRTTTWCNGAIRTKGTR